MTFVADNPNESASAYRDTIGDLVNSLCGSIIGALHVGTFLWNSQNPNIGAAVSSGDT